MATQLKTDPFHARDTFDTGSVGKVDIEGDSPLIRQRDDGPSVVA